MDSTKVFVDSIYAVVKIQSEVPAKEHGCTNNWDDVAIVAIIAVTSLIAILFVTCKIYSIVKMQKYEGIKAIVEEIIEERAKQSNKNGEQV